MLACGWLSAYATRLIAAPPPGYELVWADEFDGNTLNPTNWSNWLSGKRRAAINSADSVSVTNDLLTITTFSENGKIFTGMVASEKKFEPTYGYFEARIKFNDTPGTWSAFWMQSPTIHAVTDNPSKSGTEIDIVEHRHDDKTGAFIADKAVANLHWNGYGRDHKTSGTRLFGSGLDEGFHLYALQWTPEQQDFFVDGTRMWSVTNPVSQHSEFIIFSSEVEDGGWAGKVPAGGYGPRNISTNCLQVDYVRVFQKPTVQEQSITK